MAMTKVNIIELPPLWVTVKELQRLFMLGHTHTRELVNEMRQSRKWRGSVVVYDRVLRVNLADFETFCRKKSILKGGELA